MLQRFAHALCTGAKSEIRIMTDSSIWQQKILSFLRRSLSHAKMKRPRNYFGSKKLAKV